VRATQRIAANGKVSAANEWKQPNKKGELYRRPSKFKADISRANFTGTFHDELPTQACGSA
jgi:hypothetical protein